MAPNQILVGEAPRRNAANVVIHAGFVVSGVATTLLGPLLPILIARWSMSDERAGLFFTLQFFGSLVGIVSLSTLISRRGYGLTFFIGFTFIAMGIAGLNLGSEIVGLLATAVFGYGLGLILSGTNLWVAEMAESRRAAALSILNLAWGIGAIACPALVMFAHRSHRLAPTLFGLASFSVLAGVTLGIMDIEPRLRMGADPRSSQPHPVLSKKAIALGALFFLYVGTETSVGGWTAALAKRMGASPGNPWELAPMFFWGGLLAGRALTAVVLSRVTERALLTMGVILAGICNGALLLVTTFWAAAVCTIGAGLGLACIYPLLIAWMVEHYGKQAKRMGSIMFALATVGGATMPWLVGFTSTHARNLRVGLLVPFFACIVMFGLMRALRQQPVI